MEGLPPNLVEREKVSQVALMIDLVEEPSVNESTRNISAQRCVWVGMCIYWGLYCWPLSLIARRISQVRSSFI